MPTSTTEICRLERRERELARAAEALESRRTSLAAVWAEYEERRRVLEQRARELDEERRSLRSAQEELLAARAVLELRTGGPGVREATPQAREAETVEPVPARPAPPVAAGGAADDRLWWTKVLGRPLEAA
jgi:hypothetical protein